MYSLESLDEDRLQEVRGTWGAQIDALEDPDQINGLSQAYDPMFTWVERLIQDGGENQPRLLVSDSDGDCAAILEIADARRAREPALKLLNLYLAPRLSAIIEFKSDAEMEELREIGDVLVYALTTAAQLAFDSAKATKLKVYGRTEEMRAFFSAIVSALGKSENFSKDFKAHRQGQWLVLERR